MKLPVMQHTVMQEALYEILDTANPYVKKGAACNAAPLV
jgi:hypothetical protein